MSNIYINRLRAVRSEFNATSEALAYTIRQQQSAAINFERVTPVHFSDASRNAEKTYYTRLYAEFEGILKDHLQTNHPAVNVPTNPKVDGLITQILRAESITLNRPLRARIDAVRDHRNALAHSTSRQAATFISFTEALSVLNTFLAKLPEPL